MKNAIENSSIIQNYKFILNFLKAAKSPEQSTISNGPNKNFRNLFQYSKEIFERERDKNALLSFFISQEKEKKNDHILNNIKDLKG